MESLLIAGGGIGGLAAALALAHQGWPVQLLERQPAFGEAGAGIQLGPNVMRLLGQWPGVAAALRPHLATPDQLCVCDAGHGRTLAQLDLRALAQRYGAPWATVHRRDLHGVLLQLLGACSQVECHLGQSVLRIDQVAQGLSLHSESGRCWHGLALLGADGVHSRVRQHLLHDGPASASGHLAFRALLRAPELPPAMRQNQITVWMGAQLHAVCYPVRQGEAFNAVVVLHGEPGEAAAGTVAATTALRHRLARIPASEAVQALAWAHEDWSTWAVWDRPPMRSAREHAQGRIALIGDAAHPMRPYLAQGAGMAVEDAHVLAQLLRDCRARELPQQLAKFAQLRWRRNARVQQVAQRNGRIYHAQGLLRWGRNLALRLLGPQLLDQPWLYGARL